MGKNYNEIEVKDNMKIKEESVEEVSAPKEKMKAIVTQQPNKVKRGLFSRLVTGVIGPEGLPGIGSYVNEEIVKPAIKNIIVDALTSGINMAVYGDKGGAPRSGYRPGTTARQPYRPGTNYSTNYRASATDAERVVHPRVARGSIPDYVIEDRMDAVNVLTSLVAAADRYDNVSVADYYDSIAVPSEYTDNNHGWSYDSISRATVVPVRGGYIIKFPPVEVL